MRNQIIGGLLLAGASLIVFSTPSIAAAQQSCGKASWYALHSRTASGEMMNPSKMTAAHRKYKFGTRLLVTNKRNGRTVVVRVNDRGPFIKGRIVDVSKAAAKKLGFVGAGHTSVCIQPV